MLFLVYLAIKWKRCGRKWSLPILRFYLRAFLKKLWKTTKKLRIAYLWTNTQIQDLLNIKKEYHFFILWLVMTNLNVPVEVIAGILNNGISWKNTLNWSETYLLSFNINTQIITLVLMTTFICGYIHSSWKAIVSPPTTEVWAWPSQNCCWDRY